MFADMVGKDIGWVVYVFIVVVVEDCDKFETVDVVVVVVVDWITLGLVSVKK